MGHDSSDFFLLTYALKKKRVIARTTCLVHGGAPLYIRACMVPVPLETYISLHILKLRVPWENQLSKKTIGDSFNTCVFCSNAYIQSFIKCLAYNVFFFFFCIASLNCLLSEQNVYCMHIHCIIFLKIHLGCHLLGESIALSVFRNLPSVHPIYKLLAPPLRHIIGINAIYRKHVLPHEKALSEFLGIGQDKGL